MTLKSDTQKKATTPKSGKKIFIDTRYGLTRIAITEHGRLLDFFEEVPDKRQEKNNVYRGQVKRIEPGLDAAFLDYGSRREGFLPLKEVGKVLRDGSDTSELQEGDILIVQVTKDGIGHKGSALTTRLALPGRFLVYLPNHASGGVSRSVNKRERGELKKILGQLKHPEGSSVIIRTVSANQTLKTLQTDLDKLQDTHALIVDNFKQSNQNGLIYQDQNSTIKFLQDYFTDEIEKIIVNSEEAKASCLQFFERYNISSVGKFQLSTEGAQLFQNDGIENQISSIRLPSVKLPSGASLVIQQTEALVSIDVNSAKTKNSSDFEKMVFSVNSEAAIEIARQIRLRDLGGIIVVDFIDMERQKHRDKIETLMKNATKSDKAAIEVHPIGPLGLMILSRQRMMGQGRHKLMQKCESCKGEGVHPPLQSTARSIFAKIEAQLKKRGGSGELIATVNPVIATYILNHHRADIQLLENQFHVFIQILPEDLSEDISCKIDRVFYGLKHQTNVKKSGERIEIQTKKYSSKKQMKNKTIPHTQKSVIKTENSDDSLKTEENSSTGLIKQSKPKNRNSRGRKARSNSSADPIPSQSSPKTDSRPSSQTQSTEEGSKLPIQKKAVKKAVKKGQSKTIAKKGAKKTVRKTAKKKVHKTVSKKAAIKIVKKTVKKTD